MPNRYEFNYALGIDVLEILDADGAKYQVLNMICLGTCFKLAEVLRNGPGQPTKALREAPSLVREDQFADLSAIEDQVDPESRFAFQQLRLGLRLRGIHPYGYK